MSSVSLHQQLNKIWLLLRKIDCRSCLLFDDLINCVELPCPLDIVEEWSQVKAIVIWRISFRMVGWSQSCKLVSVHCIEVEELLDFLRDLCRSDATPLLH